MRIVRERPKDTARRAWKHAVKYSGTLRGNPTYSVTVRQEHTVTMLADASTRKGWGCTCVHGSMYGVNKVDETCVHIKLVIEALKQRGTIAW